LPEKENFVRPAQPLGKFSTRRILFCDLALHDNPFGLRFGGASRTWKPRTHSSGEALLRDEHAVQEELDCTGCQASSADGVPTREGVDLEAVVRDLGMKDTSCGGKTAHLRNRCVAADVDRVVAVGGVDDDAVGLAVARDTTEGAGEVDVHAADVGAGQ